jgi:hypothetical protein
LRHRKVATDTRSRVASVMIASRITAPSKHVRKETSSPAFTVSAKANRAASDTSRIRFPDPSPGFANGAIALLMWAN